MPRGAGVRFAGCVDTRGLPQAARIEDGALVESRSRVRAVVVGRLEELWLAVSPHVRGEVDRVDPRMVEIGLRVTRDLGRLFGVEEREAVVAAVDDAGVREREIDAVLAALDSLEGAG